MNEVDEKYYDEYFNNLTKERKIQFLELYEEYSYSKIEILLSIIFLFPFNVFQEHFKQYKVHRTLSTIDLVVICGYGILTVLILLMGLISTIFAGIFTMLAVVFIYGYLFFTLACRIFIILQVSTIIKTANVSAKAKVYSVMEEEI